MEKKSLKITLLGRNFPVVAEEEEAFAIQQAAKMLSNKINQFRMEYGMRDEVDIVLMAGLYVATEFQKLQSQEAALQPHILAEKLTQLEKKLDISQYVE